MRRATPGSNSCSRVAPSAWCSRPIFEWLLDTRHGADYYRRWHRDKASSGGLMIHKASHHFDLMNWWLGAVPETVFGFGRLAFYGSENAVERGEARDYERALGSEAARDDPFALHLESNAELKGMYLEAEHEDGYQRDRNVFGRGISIEDDMAFVIRYSTGAGLTYHLSSYSPWEGCRVVFNGTRGRLELDAVERSFVSKSGGEADPEADRARILVRPLWGPPEAVVLDAEEDDGGHAGADLLLLEDLSESMPVRIRCAEAPATSKGCTRSCPASAPTAPSRPANRSTSRAS
jgi:predicted dehydrogenase